MKKILFVGHDANRAGAQNLLLHLLAYLKDTDVETALLLTGGGGLLEEYQNVTTVYECSQIESKPAPILGKMMRRMGLGSVPVETQKKVISEGLLDTLASQHFELIFSNTIANGAVLQELAPLNIPFVCYVHELETSIRTYTKPVDLQYQIQEAAFILCGSEAVRSNLVANHGLDRERSAVLNSIMHTKALINALKAVDCSATRKKLGIPEDAVVVGGCGNVEWRKGIDIFILVAQEVLKTHTYVHFIWVGVPHKGTEFEHLSHDLQKMGIANKVHLIKPSGDYLNYVACYDIFTLTSREDPYPLVILEAGLNKIPVLCFKDSGGSPDFVGTDTGCLVDYLDVSAMANVIKDLAEQSSKRQQLGEVFFKRAKAHDVDLLIPQMFSLLSENLILS